MHHFLRDVEKTTPTSPTPQPPVSTAACANPAGGYEGFGRNTTGGADALSIGNRCIVFDVGGTINLQSTLVTRGGNITIDGFTAPAPGITIRRYKLLIDGRATNVIARGLRIRDTNLTAGENNNDGISIENTSNVVVDHVSISGFGDGAIDVIAARDVTIQWSIFGPGNPSHNYALLVKYDAFRVTLHHNLFFDANHQPRRRPAAARKQPRLCDSQNGLNVDSQGNRSTPFAAVVPSTITGAITAAHQIVAQAGARGPRFGLDAVDQGFINQISLAR
jgi:hypothetical protein